MKNFRIFFGIAILLFTIVIVFPRTQKIQRESNKLRVVTTIFPLYDFAKYIGGEKVEVSLLLPPGIEAHSYEPKPSDIIKINQADIFIYTGNFMEPWVKDILSGISDHEGKVINVSAGIQLIPNPSFDERNSTVSTDPHIWLDFDNDKKIIQTVEKAFSKIDSRNRSYYRNKAKEYQNILSALDVRYQTSLSGCKSHEIIYGGHYAFGYLARRYNLQYRAAQGFIPDSEPTAQDLVMLVQQIQKDNIHYVFFEELSSPKVAETLAQETNTKLLLLSAAHNISKKDFENKISFVSIMEENLKNLQVGLECNN